LIEHGLTSPPTQYRLSGRQFYRSKDLTDSIKVLKEKMLLKYRKPRKDGQNSGDEEIRTFRLFTFLQPNLIQNRGKIATVR